MTVFGTTYLLYTAITEVKDGRKKKGIDRKHSFYWAGMLFVMSGILIGLMIGNLFK